MKSLFSIAGLSIFFGVYYISLSFFLADGGYINFEHLFISDKLYLLFSSDVHTLEIFYFTYPVIAQIFAMPAAIIDPILAPVITSCILIAIFGGYITMKLYRLNFKLLAALTFIYFLISPVMIFLSVSGTSLYINVVLYFMFFHFILKYTRDFTTYNFVILSICLSAFVFLDYSFLWVIIFMIPLILFFSIFNTIGIKKTYIGIFGQITQKSSQTRKLFARLSSAFLVIVFPPLASFLFYILINYWITGSFFYFDEASAFSWNRNKFLDYTFFESTTSTVDTSYGLNYLIEKALLLGPIFIAILFLGRKRLLFQYTMVMVPLWLIFYKNYGGGQFISLHALLILTAAGIAGVIHLLHTPLANVYLKNRATPIVLLTVFVATVTGEYFYFKTTNDAVERSLFEFVQQSLKNKNIGEFQKLAAYIESNLDKDDVILADNAIFYPAMALTRDKVGYLDQFKDTYYAALQLPYLYSDYVLTSNANSIYFENDKLKVLLHNPNINLETVYSNELFTLHRLNNMTELDIPLLGNSDVLPLEETE